MSKFIQYRAWLLLTRHVICHKVRCKELKTEGAAFVPKVLDSFLWQLEAIKGQPQLNSPTAKWGRPCEGLQGGIPPLWEEIIIVVDSRGPTFDTPDWGVAEYRT